jgi:eukaryotic-like serine/threonine-protein kinase
MTALRRTPVAAPGHSPEYGFQVGQVIDGRYQIMELLWSGATAHVCRVRHTVLGRTFALKTLRTECCRDAEWVQRLLREARALASLTHPNIVAVIDQGWLPSSEPYFVMEYAPGVSLERWLRAGPMELEVVLEVAGSICDALEAAHQLGIVHRDLKPENIRVDQRGGKFSIKVLDFGLAQVAGLQRLTRPSTTHGTPQYMSPEQVTGTRTDARTDLYSLGVMLYEMLCGRLPFSAQSYLALAHQHGYAPPPPFRRWLPANSPALRLEPLVLRLLQKDRALRFQSALELGQALAPFRARSATVRLRTVTPAPGSVAVQPKVPSAPSTPAAYELPPGFAARPLSYATLAFWAVLGVCLGGALWQLAVWQLAM